MFMGNNLLDRLEEDIDKSNLNFIVKSRTNKGIYLFYLNDSTAEEYRFPDEKEKDEITRKARKKYEEVLKSIPEGKDSTPEYVFVNELYEEAQKGPLTVLSEKYQKDFNVLTRMLCDFNSAIKEFGFEKDKFNEETLLEIDEKKSFEIYSFELK